jgi:hypothetical protein
MAMRRELPCAGKATEVAHREGLHSAGSNQPNRVAEADDMTDQRVGEKTRILTLRLDPGVTPSVFRAALEARCGPLNGSPLTWLHADWFALPEPAEEALRARIGGGDALIAALRQAGALEGRWVDWSGFVALTRLRDAGGGFAVHALRDRVGVPVEPSAFPIDSGSLRGGRPVRLDWHLTLTGIPAAWAMFDPAAGSVPWKDIRVAHIDTGCTEHPAFGFGGADGTWLRPDLGLNLHAERVSATPGEGFDLSWTRTPESAGPFDNLEGPFAGHGTRTASMITGHYDTGEPDFVDPFYGAAPGVPVVPYRVTDTVIVDHVMDLIARAIRHAVEERACQVISISLGSISPSRKLSNAIDLAYDAGVIICAAAGNLIREVTYPGRYNRVLTVGGATTADGVGFAPWDGASRGQFVDICGPADQIRRASVTRRAGRTEYVIGGPGDGTSFATALCAGIAALWLARRGPELDAVYGNDRWMRVAAFKRLIKQTARSTPSWDHTNYGAGLCQADGLLAAELPAAATLHREARAAEPFDPLP